MNELLESFSAEARLLMEQLQNGLISPSEWETAMQAALAKWHMAGMMAGMGDISLPVTAVPLLEKTLDDQFRYLANFAMVMQAAGEFQQGWYARANLYALSPKTSYQEGRIYRDVGRFLPLPAMPAQGTQCHTNCKCAWEIKTLDADAEDYDAYWRRAADDSCQTCIQRERDWNPVRIRGGMLQ